jgi:hypothetical protein
LQDKPFYEEKFMSDQPAGASQATTEVSATQAILAEYEIFKKKYTKDALVQSMAAQLARLAGISQDADVQPADVPTDDAKGEPAQGPVDVVSAMAGYLSRCSSGGMPPEQVAVVESAVAQAQDLGYFALLRAPAGMNASDVERLLYAGRVLRAIADEGHEAPVGDLWGEVVCASGAIKRVLNLEDVDMPRLGLIAASMLPPGGKSARSVMLEGWKEAVIGWEVCSSIHRSYAKGKDAVFKTRQSDYARHAATARARYFALAGMDQGDKA